MAVQPIPAGFSDLAKPKVLWLETFYYGQSLGIFKVTADLQHIIFNDPAKVIAAMTNRFGEDKEFYPELEHNLATELDKNTNLACSSNGEAAGCDIIDKGQVGIIFDENNQRLMLFTPSNVKLKTQAGGVKYYQSPPDTYNALVHQQTLNYSVDKNTKNVSLQGNGAIGLGKDRYASVDWNWNYASWHGQQNHLMQLNNAFVRQDLWKTVYIQAGQMDTRDIYSSAGGSIALNQLPINAIKGIRIGSTNQWVDTVATNTATPVNVFLSQSARVDVYRGEQLISSFYLDAGTQALNTNNFPTGSYTLTLKIYENNQLIRTENMPFTNFSRSNHQGFQWFLQAGKLAKVRDYSQDRDTKPDNNHTIVGGFRLPLNQNTALSMGSSVLSNAVYSEAVLDWQHGFDGRIIDGILSSRVSYYHGSDGTRGNTQQLSYSDGFSLSLYRTQLGAEDCTADRRKRYGASSCSNSFTGLISAPIAGWNTSLSYSLASSSASYRRRDSLPAYDERQLGLPWQGIFTSSSKSRTLSFGLSRTFTMGNVLLSTGLTAFTSQNTAYGAPDKGGYLNLSLSFNNQLNSGSNISTQLGSNWNISKRYGNKLGYNANVTGTNQNQTWNINASGINGDSTNLGGYVGTSTAYGDGTIAINDNYDRRYNQHKTNSTGTFNSSLVAWRHGITLAPWVNGYNASAVAVKVSSDAGAGALINANINSVGGGSVDISAGHSKILSIPGYNQTDLAINESEDSKSSVGTDILQGAGQTSLFLTPGRIYQREVKIKSNYTWVGKFVDNRGKPLEDTVPLNISSWDPLPNGGFMLNTDKKISEVYVMKGEQFWQCRINVRQVKDIVHWAGDTTCSETTMAKLPESELKQVGLMTAGTRNAESGNS